MRLFFCVLFLGEMEISCVVYFCVFCLDEKLWLRKVLSNRGRYVRMGIVGEGGV